MKKVSIILAVLLLATGLLAGCGGTKQNADLPKEDVNIVVLKGSTGMGAVSLMDKNDKGEASANYHFTVADAPDKVVAMVANGEVDIAAVPTNLAATLYNKTNGNVQMAAINTLGVLYILENGDTINSIDDLAGKTLYATGQGANPEFVINYILQQNGLKPGQDVEVEYKAQHDELATLLATDQVAIGMLPEPNVTAAMAQNDKLRIALNITDEWNKVAGGESQLAMGCVIVSKSFAESHADVVDAFLSEYQESINYVKDNVAEAGTLCEKYGIIPKAALAQKAIPNCNLTFIAGAEMKTAIAGYYTVLFNADPKSIGGKLPDDAFYYAQ